MGKESYLWVIWIMPEPSKGASCVGGPDFQEKGTLQIYGCIKTLRSQEPGSPIRWDCANWVGGCTSHGNSTAKTLQATLWMWLRKVIPCSLQWSSNRWSNHVVPRIVSSGCGENLESPHASNTEPSPWADGQEWKGPTKSSHLSAFC